jgi:hypothetical protein
MCLYVKLFSLYACYENQVRANEQKIKKDLLLYEGGENDL